MCSAPRCQLDLHLGSATAEQPRPKVTLFQQLTLERGVTALSKHPHPLCSYNPLPGTARDRRRANTPLKPERLE